MRRAADRPTNGTVTRAVLIRDVPVCLVNVRFSGCLLEIRTRLQSASGRPVAGDRQRRGPGR